MFIDNVLKEYTEMPKPETIFKIQNVSDYYFEVSEQDELDFKQDIFSFMLPFTSCWFEYKQPSMVKVKKQNYINPWVRSCVGVLASMKTIQDVLAVAFYTFLEDSGKPQLKISEVLYCEQNGKFPYPTPVYSDYPGNDLLMVPNTMTEEEREFARDITTPVLIALNFLHCKNVKTLGNNFDQKFIKIRKKRNNPYFEKYYTLHIEPMKKILNEKGGAETNGLRKAMHICRGHFSTYTAEKPLFGKVAGTFWIPAHVRGDASTGVIKKDYAIKALS